MDKDFINLFVLIPSGGQWMSKFGRALALLTSYFAVVQVFPGVKQRLSLATVECSLLCASREKLMLQALQNDASHALFLDSDMDFPMDTAHRLLRREKDFICANYPSRSEPAVPVAVNAQGKKFIPGKKAGVEKIQHGGFGCCLINVDCVKKLRPPLFLMDWVPDLHSYCGEDVYFSQKMAEIGVDLWVDHDLSNEMGHVGYKRYSFDDVSIDTLKEHNATLA